MKIRKPLSKLCLALGLVATTTFSQAALLGVVPNEPTVDFGGAGIVNYDAVTGLVTISGTPATLFQTAPFLYGEVLGTGVDDEKLVTIKFHVDSSGHLLSGITGPDLIVKGSIDTDFDGVADYDGILLEAEVIAFGFEDGVAGASDVFDLRFDTVTGVLAPLYNGKDIALNVVSETSVEFLTPFAGSFASNFMGQAKGVLGATDPVLPPSSVACQLNVAATCSVGDSSDDKTKCRIKVSKSPKHWEHVDVDYHGHTFRRSEYGMHGHQVPSWASRYPTTNVTFSYVVTNTGTTPVSNMLVTDSFETGVTGVPALLEPGASVTFTRVEKLSEGIDNTVTVMGEYQSAVCADSDVVVIKDKLRERREHDEDRYKDKGKRGD
jgi:hypothetical protein